MLVAISSLTLNWIYWIRRRIRTEYESRVARRENLFWYKRTCTLDNFIYQRTISVYPASPAVTSEEQRCNDDDNGLANREDTF